ncbi:hypothetical protein FQN54_006637 [Arachnomyces sp. PD_36]|nr:hypothetical protein FQN54_006637 [Arachnomyces sp. PD_36]
MTTSTPEPSQAQAIKDDIRKAYDDIAPAYLDWTKPSYKTRLVYLNKLLSHLSQKPKVNVLELGCGAGVPCTQLLAARENFSVTANDISHAQIELARERLPSSVRLVEGDMMGLESEEEEFDAVVGFFSILHLPREEQIVFFNRAFGWLKPGGWLLANLTKVGFESVKDEKWLGGKEGTMFWSGWGVEKSCEILEEAGFVVEVKDVVSEAEKDWEGKDNVEFLWVMARKPDGP